MEKYTIGVISDTHGLLRPEIFSIFSKVNLIIHAGDIGRPEVLSDLNAISSTIAVLGNVDSRYDFPKLKLSETVEIMGYRIYVTHNRQLIRINPREQGIDLVIFGHSHQPCWSKRMAWCTLIPAVLDRGASPIRLLQESSILLPIRLKLNTSS